MNSLSSKCECLSVLGFLVVGFLVLLGSVLIVTGVLLNPWLIPILLLLGVFHRSDKSPREKVYAKDKDVIFFALTGMFFISILCFYGVWNAGRF